MEYFVDRHYLKGIIFKLISRSNINLLTYLLLQIKFYLPKLDGTLDGNCDGNIFCAVGIAPCALYELGWLPK